MFHSHELRLRSVIPSNERLGLLQLKGRLDLASAQHSQTETRILHRLHSCPGAFTGYEFSIRGDRLLCRNRHLLLDDVARLRVPDDEVVFPWRHVLNFKLSFTIGEGIIRIVHRETPADRKSTRLNSSHA